MLRRNALRFGLLALTGNAAAAGSRMQAAGRRPPSGASVLFNGSDLSAWISRNGSPANWTLAGRYVEVNPGSGDIMSAEVFGDFQLHLEFWLPHLPEAVGQARANSGVYLQGRYEIQVLDSYGQEPQVDGCGAIYGQSPPLRNANKRAERWQTYDIAFRAARTSSGAVFERARVTVIHNGILIHNNQEITGATGGMLDANEGTPGPLLLQDHGDRVRYRNIWILAA